MGLIIDNFAGGGGASTGIEAALGRAVDYAINHDEQAIRMHEANHPGTVHIRNNIWQIDPRDIAQGRPVDLAWFSPDCKHFSKAKGGKPREKSIRDLAWVVVLWAQRVKPALILLENVEEFRTWGPLCGEGKPIKARQGETFDKWCGELRKAGYKLQFRELRACDYGAPTIRKRFFMIARCDGEPIAWPEPTHAPADEAEREAWVRRQRKAGFKVGRPDTLKPWRTAAEIIDWSIPCPSIFERKKPLADKTLRRIAHGIMKFVVNNPRPFVVPAVIVGCGGRRGQSGPVAMDQPYPTTTTKADACLILPHITKFRNGATGHPADEPLHTVTANSYVKRPGGSAPLGRVDAVLAPLVVGTAFKNTRASRSFDPQDPLRTQTAQPEYAVAAAHLIHRGNGEREGQAPRAMDAGKPLGTAVASGIKHAAVTAFMQKFAQNGRGIDPTEPLHTVMAGAPRHAIVTAHIEQANGSPEGEKPLPGRKADDPLSTIVAKGCTQRVVTSNLVKLKKDCIGQSVEEPLETVTTRSHMAEVRAFLIKYYGNEQDGHGLESPLGTVTVNDRFGLVTVTIEGEEYVIVDIGMRMLTPRELFAAQGFPPDYVIEHDAACKPITKTAQVAKCGNSVCPPLAEALVRANAAECREAEVEAA